MKDAGRKVIYVGKAKNLRRRLASYFRNDPGHWKVERLVEEIADIEVILVHNEVESLVLENNLIKRYRPRYNSFLVSEKSGYPYLLLTREEFPRFVRYKRNVMNKLLKGLQEEDCERRFGPYLSYQFNEELMDFVSEKFRLRVCDPLPKRACLLFHLNRCSAPCEGRISREAYAASVESAAAFLSQQNTALIQHLRAHMLECAERLEFERAQRIKEKLAALEVGMAQQVVERDVDFDQGVFYFGEGIVLAASIHRGTLTGVRLLGFAGFGNPAEAPRRFLLAYCAHNCPPELIVNRLDHPGEVETALASACGRPVRILIPAEGPEYALVTLCELNYTYRMKEQEERK
jgi:excinuclease ABC subunit C